jgi:hypothetical protein
MNLTTSLEKENVQLQIQKLPKKKKSKQNQKEEKHKTRKLNKSSKKTTVKDGSGNELEIEDIGSNEPNSDNNWTGNNISTLLSWLSNANYNIECLDLSIEDCSKTIRHNVILGLMMSTGAGTISTANMGIVSDGQAKFILNIVFTVMAFIIAINTGRIKVYQIQERLEQFIKLKQEWTYFITTIAVEFQTPVALRKDALQLILNNKEKYLDLMKRDCEFTEKSKKVMENRIQEDINQWFQLNNEFYNSHVSLLNFSKGIRINDLVDSMSYFEGMNLIEAEKNAGYNPNKNIAPFYDKVKKYDVIRHFYEMDLEETRKKNTWWELINEYLFPKYYEDLRVKKKEEMYRKRRERIRKEMEEEEKRLNDQFMRIKEREYAILIDDEDSEVSDISEMGSSNVAQDPDIENQIPIAPPPKPTEKAWFEYFSPFSG